MSEKQFSDWAGDHPYLAAAVFVGAACALTAFITASVFLIGGWTALWLILALWLLTAWILRK